MASNWGQLAWNLGVRGATTPLGGSAIKRCARLVGNPNTYITDSSSLGSLLRWFFIPAVGTDNLGTFVVTGASFDQPHFPYQFNVEPD